MTLIYWNINCHFQTTFALHVKAEESKFLCQNIEEYRSGHIDLHPLKLKLFNPAGVVTTVFIGPRKVTVKIGDGGDVGIKIDKKGQKISFIQLYLEYPSKGNFAHTWEDINPEIYCSQILHSAGIYQLLHTNLLSFAFKLQTLSKNYIDSAN